jgi:polyisoprenoid-binding protein YceI
MAHRRMQGLLAVWLALGAGPLVVWGEGREFDFKDPKGVNSMTFTLDSPLEPIVGVASGVSGQVTFDPERPEGTSGRLVVQADTLHVPQPKMKEVLHSPDWLDVKKYPEISFAFKEVKQSKKLAENVYEWQIAGEFTCHGVTKPLTVTVKAAYQPGKLGERVRGKEGDLLVLRSDFAIKRSDFGIKPDTPAGVVADEIQIRAGVVGGCPKK